MTKELGALLRKKNWTGDEIGKAILYSLVDAHQQALDGVVSPSPAFSSDQLQTMIGSLSDSVQLRRYNSYIGLQNWLIQYQAVSTAYGKQVMGELDMISGVLCAALAVEEDLRNLDNLPVIMTRKQYDDLVEGKAVCDADEQKIGRSGYAIIGDDFESLMDEQGYYKASDFSLQISVKCGMEQYTASNPNREQAVRRIVEGRKVIEDGYYYVRGYDKAIELIADFLSMPEFLIFKLNAESLADRMREVEKKAAQLQERIEKGAYGKGEMRQAKLDVLRKYFSTFAWDSLEIPAAAIREAKELLTDNMRAFDKQDSAFISILTFREWRN